MDALPPDIEQVIVAARDVYLEQFRSEIADLRGKAFILEPVLLGPDGTPAVEAQGLLPLPNRLDYLDLTANAGGMVASKGVVRFEPFSFPYGNTEVTLSPFIWDSIFVTVGDAWSQAYATALSDWYGVAFGKDEGDDNTAMQNAVHFISEPIVDPTGFTINIDFGTAPASAVADLLEALESRGAPQVSLATPLE
ncbi:hypothetical protein [Oricola sp.]|uniref:hypothetical protein n=1 Tax=Oricola sp. TaxID=1979950 RepID=UPI0025FABD1E|nr:hypothetical protein [Oricola sp.]MCI5074326.1 hypothetical protein [Oricola sp.]